MLIIFNAAGRCPYGTDRRDWGSGTAPAAEVIAVKLVRLVELDMSFAGDACEAVWDDHVRSLVEAHPSIVRRVLNTVTEPAPEASPLHCDAVDEVGFASLGDLVYSVSVDDLTVLRDGAGRTIGAARVFVTNEVVPYDAGQLEPIASP
jgi:hypothetical protein